MNLDKMLERAKASRDKNKEKVKQDQIKKMGKRAYQKMIEEQEYESKRKMIEEQNNRVIESLSNQVEETEPGSKKEQDLMNRIMRLRKELYK